MEVKDSFTLVIQGEEKSYPSGITYGEIAAEYADRYPILRSLGF